MGLAMQSVAAFVANPGASFTAAAATAPDSLTVASFSATSQAYLEGIVRGGATAGAVRIISPRLHDNVTGLTYYTDKAGTQFQLPRGVGNPLQPSDTLTVQLTGGTAETDVAMLRIYYEDLPGSAARLHSWEEIEPLIEQIKPITVAVTANGTAGLWKDTAINTTDKQLKANRDYAILGYSTDAALTAIGIVGPDTSNYRMAGPGADDTILVPEFFMTESTRTGRPHIPVINANNVGATNVSVLDKAASTTANVTIIAALLSQNLPSPS